MSNIFYTIGYEGATLEDFVATLLSTGVETLVDVREMPLSRKRGFSKTALGEIMVANGIDYVHLRGLGDPKEGRDAARAGEMEVFEHIFRNHMNTDKAQFDLQEAVDIVQNSAACLLCFEREATCCHRSIVAEHLISMTGYKKHNLGVTKGIASEYGCIRYPEAQAA